MAEIECPECGAPPAILNGFGRTVASFTCGSTPESLAEGFHIANAEDRARWRKRCWERSRELAREAARA